MWIVNLTFDIWPKKSTWSILSTQFQNISAKFDEEAHIVNSLVSSLFITRIDGRNHISVTISPSQRIARE